jgi:hypothetical protein
MLVISLGATGWDYFVRYPARPDTPYAFEDAAANMAAEVNSFLGIGWDRSGMVESRTPPKADRQVYVDRRVWDEWTSTAFLVPATELITVFSPDSPPSPSKPAMLVFWPHDGLEPYASALPRNSRITARAGPLTRGDLEETPYIAYVTYVVMPRAQHSTDHIAHFDDGIALADYAFETKNGIWEVVLEWMTLSAPGDNYTVSVSLFDEGQPVAQDDAEPAEGYYPTGLWRPGDLVVDRHTLELSEDRLSDARLVVGLYLWPTMEPLEASDPNGVPLGTRVSLPVTTTSSR